MSIFKSIAKGLGSVAGPLIGGAASIIGGSMQSQGQKDANKANIALAKENRDFQERMSSTAYQRAATDLEAAGLNRILALGRPATTPGGSVATVGNEGMGMGMGIADSPSSAMEVRAQTLQLKEAQSRIHLMDTQEKLNDANALKSYNEADLAAKQQANAEVTNNLLREQIKQVATQTQGHSADNVRRILEATLYSDYPSIIPTEKAAAIGGDLLDTILKNLKIPGQGRRKKNP